MTEEELGHLGQNLKMMYAKRRELEQVASPDVSADMPEIKADGRAKKVVTWADMKKQDGESEGSLPLVHGGG